MLHTAGGLVAGAALGGLASRSASAAPGARAEGATDAAVGADVGIAASPLALSQRINLGDDSTELIREKALHRASVIQSFAIDNVNRHIYAAQLTDAAAGDLCVTKLDMAGNELGYMYLTGFGHGVQIGVEPAGTSAYLWTETDSVSERGTKLARFKFVSGTTLDNGSSGLEKHAPVPGSTVNTCTIDPTTNRLILRYSLNGQMMFRVYNLADVKARNYTPLVEVPEPYIVGNMPQPFQGYAVIGRFLYMLEGSAYGNDNSVYPEGNTYVTCLDLNTGTIVDRQHTRAGWSLDYREPEGMGVHLPNLSDPSTARLCFGFASGGAGARKASIFYKDLKAAGSWPRNVVAGDVVMIKAASGVMVSYRVAADGALWGSQQGSPGGSYGAWGRLSDPGMFTGSPTGMLTALDTIAIHALGVDRKVWAVGQPRPGAAFGPWTVVGTNAADVDLASSPSPVVAANGATVLYALGTDGWIWGCQAPVGGTYGAWGRIGDHGGFVDTPAAMVNPNGTIAVYARGTDNAIHTIGQNRVGGAFGPWSLVGVNAPDVALAGPASPVIAANGTVVLYALGADGWIWGCQIPLGGTFNDWRQIGLSGGIASRPQPLLLPNDTLVVYARGVDSQMHAAGQDRFGAAFTPWVVVGTGSAPLTGDPSAALNATGAKVIHTLGTDARIWGSSQTTASGSFAAWAPVGG
jgi:hypothetical protein